MKENKEKNKYTFLKNKYQNGFTKIKNNKI